MPESTTTAVILAGGLGTRLAPVLPDTQKVLAPIGTKPFLTLLLNQLIAAQFQEVVVCTGYLAGGFIKSIGHQFGPLKISYSHEEQPLGTGGALRWALDQIRSDPFLVMNGDSYLKTDLKPFLTWFFSRPADAGLIMTWVPDSARYGSLNVDAHDGILQFNEKKGQATPGWINAGIYLLRKRFIEPLPPGKSISLENELFPRLTGKGLYGYRCTDHFIDIGTPESYRSAQSLLVE